VIKFDSLVFDGGVEVEVENSIEVENSVEIEEQYWS
tara:strand:+ start:5200 stop:5307 length:108 start_codon:yes stop_codon:yes gene_type:complete